jgi:hypothetical protein
MSSDVLNFETVCLQLERADTHVTAAQQLESLRAAPLSISLPLARRVLDESNSSLALFHAVLLIRTVTIRAWQNISSMERAATRDYLLNFAFTRAQRLKDRNNGISEEAALMQAIVAVAVLWKRNWLETSTSSSSSSSSTSSYSSLSGLPNSLVGNDDPSWAHGVFFDQISRFLFSNSSDLERIGARLALTLVQEMSASDAGLGSAAVSAGGARATALGMSQSFHSETAKAFLKKGLREIFVLLSQCLLQKLQLQLQQLQQQQLSSSSSSSQVNVSTLSLPTPALLLLLLEGLQSCLAWDFSGMRGSGSASAAGLSRVSPGAAWRDLLVDSNRTISTALLSLYLTTRLAAPGSGEAQVSIASRQLLCLLAGLEGDIFSSDLSAAEHGEKIASCLCTILAEPMLGAVQSMVERDKSKSVAFINVADYFELADREAQDVLRAMAVCIRTYRLQQLVRVGSNIAYLMSVASSLGSRVLSEIFSVANDFLKASAEATAATTLAVSSGHSQNRSHEKSVERATKTAVSEFVKERYESAMEIIEALLDVWSTVTRELGDSEGAVRDASNAEAAASASVFYSISSSLAPFASDFFEKLIQTRLAIGASIIKAGLDDDDPLEDASALSDHLDHVALIGRFNPSQPLVFLQKMINQSSHSMFQLLQTQSQSQGQWSKNDEINLHMSFEELYWLVTYSGHLLADNPLGETPEVPPSLNRLSVGLHAAAISNGVSPSDATRMDPIAQLSWEVLNLSNMEASRLETDVYSTSSPLLAEKLLWFQARWARTYLFIASSSVTYSSTTVSSTSGRNSPAMSMSFFSPASAASNPSSSSSSFSNLSTTSLSSSSTSLKIAGADTRGMSLSLLNAFSEANNALIGLFDSTNNNILRFSGGGSSPTSLQPLRDGVALRTLPIDTDGGGGGGGGQSSLNGLNGRFALEVCVRNAIIGLSAWTAKRNEERIGDASINLLRNLCANETIAKFFFLSPSTARLAEATLSLISGSLDTQQGFTFSLHESITPNDVHFLAMASSLFELAPEIQGKLLTLLLGNVRYIGAEQGGGFFEARECVMDDETGSKLSNSSTNLAVRAVGFRWHSFATPYITRLESRLRFILSSEPFLKTPHDPRVVRELERLLQLHSAVFKGTIHGIPSAWHISASLLCLQACAPLIDYYKAVDRPTSCSLAYCLDFLTIESEVLKEPSASLAVFTAIAKVFHAYAKHHQGMVITSSHTNNTNSSNTIQKQHTQVTSNGRMAALTSAFEEEKYEDLLILLRILELIADKEDLDLSLSSSSISTSTSTSTNTMSPVTSFSFSDSNTGTQGSGDNASSCLLVGLSFVVPLMSSHSALLGFPKLFAVYMGVLSHVIIRHPSSLSKMDHSLFSVLVQSLEAGISHHDGDVTRLSLDSIHGLGFFHFNAKRKGGITYSALDLSTHLVRIPHLFSGLAKSLLQLSIGSGVGFSLDLIPRVSDALCAMIVCDPQGYISLVQSLLSAQVNTSSNTLGDERGGEGVSLSSQLQYAFDTLTSELFSLFQSFTNNAPVSVIGNVTTSTSLSISKGGGGGMQQQRHPLDRLSKNAFRKRFEVFVIAVRGLTVVI